MGVRSFARVLLALLYTGSLWSAPVAEMAAPSCGGKLRNSSPSSLYQDRNFASPTSTGPRRTRTEPGQEFRLSYEGEIAAQAEFFKAQAEHTRTGKAKVAAQVKAGEELARAKSELKIAEANLARSAPENRARNESEVAQALVALKNAEAQKRAADNMPVAPGYQPKPTLTGRAAKEYVSKRLKGKNVDSARKEAESIRAEIEKPLAEIDAKYTEYLIQEDAIKQMSDGPAKTRALQVQRQLRQDIEARYDAILPKTKALSDALLDEQLLKLVNKSNIDDDFAIFDGADAMRMNESIHSKGEFFPDRPVFLFRASTKNGEEPPIFIRGTGDRGNPAGDYYIPEVATFDSGSSMQRFSATPDVNNYTKYWRVQFNPGDQFLVGSCGDLRPDFTRSLDVVVPEKIDPRRGDFVYTARVPMVGGAVQIKRPSPSYFPAFASGSTLDGTNFVGMSAGLQGRALEPHMKAVAAKKRGFYDESNYELALKYTQQDAKSAQDKLNELKGRMALRVPDQFSALENAKLRHEIDLMEREVKGYASRIHYLKMEMDSVQSPQKFANHYDIGREGQIGIELQKLEAAKSTANPGQLLSIEQSIAGLNAELSDLSSMSPRERRFLYEYFSTEANSQDDRYRGISSWE